MKEIEIGKIKGTAYIYDPETKTVREIETEAIVKVHLLEPRVEEKWPEYYRPFSVVLLAESRCPYDGEKLEFSVIWADKVGDFDERYHAGDCVHFAPRCLLHITSKEIDKVEEGFLFTKETLEEFIGKIGWKVKTREIFGGNFYVFQIKKKGGRKNEKRKRKP